MDRSLAGESRRATAESGSDMSTTPQAEGQAASQAASPTGFTAVNGSRGSPQSSRASDNMSARPVTAESQPRDHTAATNGDGNYHQPHVSPLNGPVKRKRSVEGDAGEDMSAEEDESDSPEEENYIEDNEYGQRGDEPSRNASWNGRSSMDSGDLHMAEALRRETHTNGHSRPSDGSEMAAGLPSHGEYVMTSANVKVDPKKRKRAFTKRTKTGCQTCRKRKKKCDETKPFCNNCERGGFVCEGYSQKALFTRTAVPKSNPTPIVSKENFPDHPTMTPSARQNTFPPSHGSMAGGSIRRTPQNGILDDPGVSAGRAPSSEWSQPVYPAPPPQHRVPMSSYPPPPAGYPSHMDRLPPSSAFSSPANGLAYDTHQSIARQTLEMSKAVAPMQSEKEKMQRGKTYNMLDSELQHDREQCRKNLNTFNTSVVSTAERERQLRSIIEPEGALQQQQQASLHGPSDTSRLSKNVIVEAPFRCDYGYNVNLAPKVWIEAGCTITDAAEVRICEGAHIGPDVKILGRVEPWNPQFWWRADPTGRPTVRIAKGIQIIIGRNVFIGGGAVIAPEWDPKWDPNRDSEDARPPRLEIGNNARILPGAVVRRDVPADSVWGLTESLPGLRTDR